VGNSVALLTRSFAVPSVAACTLATRSRLGEASDRSYQDGWERTFSSQPVAG
jgi:hypothetical protein